MNHFLKRSDPEDQSIIALKLKESASDCLANPLWPFHHEPPQLVNPFNMALDLSLINGSEFIVEMDRFVIRPAAEADSEFVSIGIREAERCNVGVGIYDVVLNQTLASIDGTNREAPDDASRYLEHAFLNDTKSHIYKGNFLVAVDTASGQPVACCCNFPYPEFKLSASILGLQAALKNTLGYSDETAKTAFEKWSFLDSAFPDVNYDDSWMLEAVYVSPSYRGQGLAQRILQANMLSQPGRKHLTSDPSAPDRRFLITCAVGNDGAERVYERLGFSVVGRGSSEECLQAIHCEGFYVLST